MITPFFPSSLITSLRNIWTSNKFVSHIITIDTLYPADSEKRPAIPHELYLTEQELLHFNDFHRDKRKYEWLAGRICAKVAVRDFCNFFHPQKPEIDHNLIEIVALKSGRPRVHLLSSSTSLQLPKISISHSNNYAVALASDIYGGVDIQHITQRIVRVKKRFCHDREEILLDRTFGNQESITSLSRLWAAKEATQKALSHSKMPGFLDLCLVNIVQQQGKYLLTFEHKNSPGKMIIKVLTDQFEEYAMGFCLL